MQFQGVTRFPEWKALYDAVIPLIEGGQERFAYEELDQLAGLEMRTNRGRGQFYRFRKELLKTKQLWMENISGCGYVIIPAKDHPVAAYKRVTAARRRVNMAKSINANVRIEELTPEQRLIQAATSAVLHQLSKTFHQVGHRFALASQDPSKLPIDLQELTKSINSPPKRLAAGNEK